MATRNKTLLGACIVSAISSSVVVASETYKSIANTIDINAESEVELTLHKLSEDDTPSCVGDDKSINFVLDDTKPGTGKWLDMMLLARSGQQLLNFSFDPANCELTSLGYPELFINNGEDGPSAGLEKTGTRGNVALIGTNNIEESSITASAHNNSDVPAAAFDGHIYLEKINDDSAGEVGRGIWLTKIKSDDGKSFIEPWIQIDFTESVTLDSIGIIINEKSLDLGRLPKEITVLASNNGEGFKAVAKAQLSKAEVNTINFNSPTKARFFKVVIKGNHGDRTYVEIDEVEFYQNQ